MDDDVSAIAGGFLGTAVITVLLVVFDTVAPVTIDPFTRIAAFVGTDNTLLGLAIFFGLGTFAWSFLFVTLGRFLPGRTGVGRGIVFSLFLWVGFASTFTPGTPLLELALFLGFTLLIHVVYGFTMGSVYERFADHDIEIV